jgi:hypothetical protein
MPTLSRILIFKENKMYFDQIKAELVEAQDVLNKFVSDDNNIKLIEKAAKLLAESFKNGGKVLSCGNGGSHCDAMHFAEELTGRYRENRPGYPAIAISDVSHLSCVSNDFGYEYVFSHSSNPKRKPSSNPKPISIKVICVCCQSSSIWEVNCSHTSLGEGNM